MRSAPGDDVPSPPRDDARRAPGAEATWLPLDPAATLLPGRGDPIALLVATCLRKAFVPVLWLGLMAAGVLAGAGDSFEADDVDAYVGELWSPFAGIVLAIGLRVLAAAVAFVLAWRVATAQQQDAAAPPRLRAVRSPAQARSWLHRWPDRYHLAHALRSLRWTEPVRQTAEDRAGPAGARLSMLARALGIASWVLFVVMVGVLFAASALVLGAYAPGP